MNAMTTLTRRQFARLLTAAAAVPMMGIAGGWAAPAPSGPAEELTALFVHRPSARAVGRAYLRTAPQEADAGTLLHRLRAEAPDLFAAERRHLRQAAAERLRRDFAEGRTVTVRGWLLSRTEARLCALCALTG